MSNLFIFGLSLCLLASPVGCAHQHPRLAVSLSDEDRAAFKSIGIASARFAPEAHFVLPPAGAVAGAERGAGIGARRSLEFGAHVADEFFKAATHINSPTAGGLIAFAAITALALGVAFAPPAALVSGIHGAVNAERSEIVQEADLALRNVFAEANVQEILRDHIVEAAAKDTRYALTVLKNDGPSRAGELADYRSAIEGGVQAVLEIGLLDVELLSEWVANPPLRLRMNAQARLIRASDNRVLYDRQFVYVGGERSLGEWAADNAQALREEFEQCYDTLATDIVRGIFTHYLQAD